MQDAAAAQEVLKEAAERLTGHLRLSMPVEFGLTLIAPIIDEFARLYPEITFEADLTPRPANFVDENVDLSIRLGEIERSFADRPPSWQRGAARSTRRRPILRRHGEPQHPRDLGRARVHPAILYGAAGRLACWSRARRSIDVNVHGRFSTNNVSMTLKFAEQGHGIAALSPPIARQSYDSGAVRHILADWSLPPMPVHAVMTSRLVPARVRAFVDFLASRLTVI